MMKGNSARGMLQALRLEPATGLSVRIDEEHTPRSDHHSVGNKVPGLYVGLALIGGDRRSGAANGELDWREAGWRDALVQQQQRLHGDPRHRQAQVERAPR